MSGSIAAIAAYNGTGTQGYQTTDKNLPGVKSIFWNENDTDKYYVNGSALIEVPANNSEVNYPNQTQPVIFTFPNDVDAIGELYLAISANISPPPALPVEMKLVNFISSIELCVGNQIIASKNATELNVLSNMYGVTDVVLLDFFYKNSYTQNYSYIAACANNQTLQLKVYPQTKASLDQLFVHLGVIAPATFSNLTFSLYSRVYSMVDAERNFLRNQVVPKLFPITQYSNNTIFPSSVTSDDPITINCDSFNIDASVITIYMGYPITGPPAMDAELFLNSTSYSGRITNKVLRIGPGLWSDATSDNRILRIHLSTKNDYSLTKSDLVPLSKYDSIRIKLYLAPYESSPMTAGDYDVIKATVTAVAEGYCTALYQNGAVTFNNY